MLQNIPTTFIKRSTGVVRCAGVAQRELVSMEEEM